MIPLNTARIILKRIGVCQSSNMSDSNRFVCIFPVPLDSVTAPSPRSAGPIIFGFRHAQSRSKSAGGEVAGRVAPGDDSPVESSRDQNLVPNPRRLAKTRGPNRKSRPAPAPGPRRIFDDSFDVDPVVVVVVGFDDFSPLPVS